MEILAIGDIHGKEIWKRVVSTVAADQIVFVGDYVNAKSWIFNQQSRLNLETLIDFKISNFDRVHLLLGNHDMAYLCPSIFPASTWRNVISAKMNRLYHDNRQCFEVAYQHNQYLFTHAGLSRFWYQRHQSLINVQPGDTIAEKLNALQRSNHFEVLHEKGKARGGSFEYGGITYADKTETEKNGINGYIQVVGHTKVKRPVQSKHEQGSVIYIDCLNAVDEFLCVNENKVSVMTVQGSQRTLEDA